MVTLAAAGATARLPSSGRAPALCPTPALVDGVLACSGAGAGAETSGRAGARVWLTGGRLDVNDARSRELEAIDGVGPAIARAIIEERTRRGRFTRFDELDDVDGIGPKTLAKLRGVLEVRASSR